MLKPVDGTAGLILGKRASNVARFIRKKKEYSRFVLAADAVGLTHFIFATLIAVLGEVPGLLDSVRREYGLVDWFYTNVVQWFVTLFDLVLRDAVPDAGHYKHPGLHFVYNYLDYPVYAIIRSMIGISSNSLDSFHALLVAFVVIILSSILYGLLTYIVLRFIVSLFR